ncbi:hypothetical protein ACFS5L_18815 [Streptomyces phyllanthi]|uniref:Uncharacterized protein n=1 Tax=Streptomyces phyllanthi TaxID=1803180 RepID=A0A5N8W845_9ACTN|nr:hypothetical protein [Streptomyces phyllanthi]MPY43499.1 hypothetical protein [Streptomyces phyllanthi]
MDNQEEVQTAGGADPDVLRILALDKQDDVTAWTDRGGAAPGPFAVTETGLLDELADVPRYAMLLATTTGRVSSVRLARSTMASR